MDPREQAVKTLLRIHGEGAFSNLETRQVLSRFSFSSTDKGLYITLVYGTLQNQLFLDHVLGQLIKKDLSALDPEILEILRTAVFQIFFLDRIPPYAAVDQAVEITKRLNKRAAGFVNGVLRNVLRRRESLGAVTPKGGKDTRKALSIRYSIPQGILAGYEEAFGAERTRQILPLLNTAPPLTIRVNTLKSDRDGLMADLIRDGYDACAGTLSNYAIHIRGRENPGDLTEDPRYRQGLYAVQDQGAMVVTALLGARPGETVLDMCAAPGGKTTQLAQMMGDTGEIVARDLYKSRVQLIRDQAKRLGIKSICAEIGDAAVLNPVEISAYDRILLDAPCSGFGVIRRKPEIRYRGDQAQLQALRELQRAMLDCAVQMLKPGGTLVYATCTVLRDENEGQVFDMLKRHQEMRIDQDAMGYTDPTMDGCDCFFYCRLTKN